MKRADVLFVPGVVVVVVGLAMGLSLPIGLRAQVQTSQRRPSFEVASVQRSLSDERRNFSARPGGRLVVTNMTVKDLIAAAFGMADIQALIPERILGHEFERAERCLSVTSSRDEATALHAVS